MSYEQFHRLIIINYSSLSKHQREKIVDSFFLFYLYIRKMIFRNAIIFEKYKLKEYFTFEK